MMTMLMMAAVFVHSQRKKSGQKCTTKNYVGLITTPCAYCVVRKEIACIAWFFQHVLTSLVSPLHKGTIIHEFSSSTFLPRYC